MASNLLQKEEEYRKLNEELQARNRKLMEEFDNVMKKQDNLLRESLPNEPTFDYLKLIQKKSDDARKSDVFAISRSKQNDEALKENHENVENSDKISLTCIPSSVDQMGVKGMIHFYRAKIKAMQNEFSQIQQELKNKCEEVKKFQKENIKLTEEKEKWFQAYNTSKSSLSKLENQITSFNSKCQSKENEITSLKKEIEQLKKDLKSVQLNVSGHEIRLNRALEENEKLKNAVKVGKQEEKDIKESHKKEIVEITATVKRLDKQKMELLNAFKKQLQLVDNLKKQKTYLEAAKLTQISETDFMRILDFKIDN